MADVLVFRWWPLVVSISRSVDQYTLISQTHRYIGLANFHEIFTSAAFYTSLRVTGLYALLRIPCEVALGFALALFVNQRFSGMTVVRTVVFVPAATSLAVMSVVWNLMYQPQYGIMNSLLNAVGLPAQNFLTDVHQALPSVALAVIWKDVGLPMIIFLAGLQGIPQEFYEAASIDGAGALHRLWTITIPLLRRTMMYVVVVTTVFSFLDFAPVYVMTRGGPQHSTYTLIYYIYESAFLNQSVGYANALTVILFILLLGLTLLQMRALRSNLEY
jgi:ABC-type sugar transport system permease subunit